MGQRRKDHAQAIKITSPVLGSMVRSLLLARGCRTCRKGKIMTEDQVRGWMLSMDEEKAARATDMPDDDSAMRTMFRAYQRLRDLGWEPGIYSPKDGSVFEALEAGCTVPGRCHYMGKWPAGGWWVHDGGDLWPSRPILWRKLPDNAEKRIVK